MPKNNQSINAYRSELFQIPESLRKLCGFSFGKGELMFSEAANCIKNSKNIFLFGMASSQWASYPMAYWLEHLGMNIHWMSAYEGIHFSFNDFPEESLAILVSQSGETIELKKVLTNLENMRNRPLILAVTNSLNSLVAKSSDILINICAGEEFCAPSKSYVNTIASLNILCSFLDNSINFKDLIKFFYNIADKIEMDNPSWMNWGEKVASNWYSQKGPIQILASGAHMGSAWQSSLLLAETSRIFSSVLDWATFRHGFEPQVNESFIGIGFEPYDSKVGVHKTTIQSINQRNGYISIVPNIFNNIKVKKEIQNTLLLNLMSTIWETIAIHYLCINMAIKKEIDPSKIERKVTLEM